MHVSSKRTRFVHYAQKRRFSISDGNVLQDIALYVHGPDVLHKIRRAFCRQSLGHVSLIRFETQQTSQVGTEVHGGAGVTGAIEVKLHLTTQHGKLHDWRFVTIV